MNFFQKVHAVEGAEPSSPPAGGEIASAFSFCPAFFFCASGVKRKSGGNKFALIKRLRLCNKKAFLREEGGPLAVEGARATQGLDKFYCNALSIFSARHVAAKKGKNPTCGFSLFSPAEKIHPFRALSDDKGISPVATGDQRPTAVDPCRLLKKAGENFQKGFERTTCVWGVRLQFFPSTLLQGANF